MSIQRARDYFRPLGREQDILEFPISSATVELAAQAAGVIPARIAKTLSFLVNDSCILIVTAGDAKIDNSKYKGFFHTKAKMLPPELVPAYEPLVRESDGAVRRYVKAADKLAAWLKCQEELKAGNSEFRRAADETMAALRDMGMEEVDWFMERLGHAFTLTLDDLG